MNTIIFDIDGVLADNKDYKFWFDETGDFQADKFEVNIPTFKTLDWGVKLIRALYREGYNIVLVTARRNAFRQATIEWLGNKGIPYHILHTKEKHLDFVEYKLNCISKYTDVLFVVEDNPELVKAYREASYIVLQPNHLYGDA